MAEPVLDEQELEDQDDPKTQRCLSFSFEQDLGKNYTDNSSKEELVLEHVLEFARQFKVIYDPTRELLLAPFNECNKRKFICSTIRPTKMPFTELYDYRMCAKFIQDYLEYEELEIPNRLPETIPSPANVLAWQAGDCFDFAIALCSMLLGTGYDAYVVYGTAPKSVTTKDESLMDCPFDTEFDDAQSDEDFTIDQDEQYLSIKKATQQSPMPEFSVALRSPRKSAFDEEQEQIKVNQEQERKFKQTNIDDDEPDYEPEDEYGRSRIHAWVMVLRDKREVKESTFIEPTTGRFFAFDNSPYHGIEAIFNDKNFWINMDPQRDVEQLNMNFQDEHNSDWEFVMMQKKTKNEDEENEEEHSDKDEDDADDAEQEILDMPPSWSPKLFIDIDKFKESIPNGEKCVFYKKCKVEIFSDCTQPDGLVKRVTLYEDYKRLITKEIRSYFACRKDNLLVRRRFPYKFKVIEHFRSSEKSFHWKKLVQVDGHYRKLYFYHHRNKDGLIYRQENIGSKTFEYYRGRDDRMNYRSVTFDAETPAQATSLKMKENHHPGTDVVINKMTQKYDLDKSLPADTQIKKTEFNLSKDTVSLFYHYREGKITTTHQQWNRSNLITQGKIGDSTSSSAGDAAGEDNFEKQKQQDILEREVKCHEQVKKHEDTALQEMNSRVEFEKFINNLRIVPSTTDMFIKILEKSVFAKARDRMKQGKNKTDDAGDQKQEEKDFLAPILKKLQLPLTGELDVAAATQVKTEALKSLKERLLTRAEIIQRRLEEEQKNLEQAYTKLKRRGDTFAQADHQQYEKEVQRANFKMDILTERASQHYRNSLEKFHELDKMLTEHKSLAAIRHGH